MSSSFDPGTVYRKVIKGDPLTDQEVIQGAQHFEDLAKSVRELGPEFKFAANEIRRTGETLRGFLKARNEHKKTP